MEISWVNVEKHNTPVVLFPPILSYVAPYQEGESRLTEKT